MYKMKFTIITGDEDIAIERSNVRAIIRQNSIDNVLRIYDDHSNHDRFAISFNGRIYRKNDKVTLSKRLEEIPWNYQLCIKRHPYFSGRCMDFFEIFVVPIKLADPCRELEIFF